MRIPGNEREPEMLRPPHAPATRAGNSKTPRFTLGDSAFSTDIQGLLRMAEEEGANGAGGQALGAAGNLPQVGVIAQYVKDLSFENPNAPAVYQWQGQPQMDVQFNIGSQNVGEDVHEVVLKVEISAKASEGTAFQMELLYGGLFALRNVPEEQLQPFLLAEAPRILFPFARRIIAEATIDAGFPPLLLDPIDFGGLYMQRAAQQQAEESGGQAGDVTGRA
jgi:preprotein translocase subunit SecB